MQCPHCSLQGCSKKGFVLGTQRYFCKDCEKHFTEKTFSATFRHRFSTDVIRGAVALLLITNSSVRNAKTILSAFGFKPPSHVTLWEWQSKFRDKLKLVSRSFQRKAYGKIFHIDEVFIRVKGSRGEFSYLVLVRDENGNILSAEVGNRRNKVLIGRALKRASALKKPRIVVSDKYSAYVPAIKRAFPKEKPFHVRAHFKPVKVKIKGKILSLTNNAIERTNGSFQEWYYGKRGFKNLFSAQKRVECWSAAHNARHSGAKFWFEVFS